MSWMYNLSQLLVACQQFVAPQSSWLLGHLRNKPFLICKRKAFSCKLSSRLGLISGLSLHGMYYPVLAKRYERISSMACSGKSLQQIQFSDFKRWGWGQKEHNIRNGRHRFSLVLFALNLGIIRVTRPQKQKKILSFFYLHFHSWWFFCCNIQQSWVL